MRPDHTSFGGGTRSRDRPVGISTDFYGPLDIELEVFDFEHNFFSNAQIELDISIMVHGHGEWTIT